MYFEARGAAEISRLLFKVAGVEFEDVRYSRDVWPSKKPGTCIAFVWYRETLFFKTVKFKCNGECLSLVKSYDTGFMNVHTGARYAYISRTL